MRLAERVGLSPRPCLQRGKRLEKAEVIANCSAVINPGAITRHEAVATAVTLAEHRGVGIDTGFSCTAIKPVVEHRGIALSCPKPPEAS